MKQRKDGDPCNPPYSLLRDNLHEFMVDTKLWWKMINRPSALDYFTSEPFAREIINASSPMDTARR